jgi:iron complex transport system permease protein
MKAFVHSYTAWLAELRYFPSSTHLKHIVYAGLLFDLIAVIIALFAGPREYLEPHLLFLRSHRVALAFLTGAMLTASGTTLQALLQNPLADPYMVGVTGGAALGGTMALLLPLHSFFLFPPTCAAAGALGATLLLARGKGHSPVTPILLGVLFNTFATAIITFVKVMLPPERARSLTFWLTGSLMYPESADLVLLLLVTATVLFFLIRNSGTLNLLALGDDDASRLGLDTEHWRHTFYILLSIGLGAIVSYVGMVGFVGFVIPHVLRLIFGADQRVLLTASIFFGGAILVLVDTISRASFFAIGTELPTGALTALIGAPFAAFIFLKRSKQYGDER